ncbi:MAG: rhodanese-like domain-containing protein [bacterium]|nr:rhodanese-like domain-containing protein [bacterium]
MKKSASIFFLIPLVALTGCISHHNTLQDHIAAAKYFETEMAYTVNPSSMKNVVKNNDSSILIVDLRKRDHFKAGHVPGAINLPFDEWNGFDGSKMNFTGLDKTKMHYVYCYEQYCNLSRKAARLFALSGYAVKEVKGGFKSYKAHNYPIQ